MARSITGEFNKSLRFADFDNEHSKYVHLPVVKGVPVTLLYRVLPGNSVGFGAGASSYGGVRTAYRMQIKPMACTYSASATPKESAEEIVPCAFRLLYLDPNQVRQLVIMDSFTEYVSMSPVAENGISNQFNYLPESSKDVGAFSFLGIQLIPLKSIADKVFSQDFTEISVPTTVTTYASAAGV